MNSSMKHTPPATERAHDGEQATPNGPLTSDKLKRRRFVQGVGIVVPTILTAGSRSALAQTCLSPSASASINHTSHKPPDGGTCSGRSPGYWSGGKLNPNNTPAIYNDGNSADLAIAQNNKFESKFFGGPLGTMMEVAALKGHDIFAAHIAAAWCNWKSLKVPSTILDEEDIIKMWSLGLFGSYQPVGGSNTVLWGKDQIQSYLTTTWS